MHNSKFHACEEERARLVLEIRRDYSCDKARIIIKIIVIIV